MKKYFLDYLLGGIIKTKNHLETMTIVIINLRQKLENAKFHKRKEYRRFFKCYMKHLV